MSLVFIDEIIVTSDVQTVTFGSGGDGELGTALDGDADEHYLLSGRWVPHASNNTFLYLRPNGVLADQISTLFRVVGSTSIGNELPFLFLSRTEMASQPVANFESSIFCRTGFPIRGLYTKGTSMSSNTDPVMHRCGSSWDEGVTNITSLGIESDPGGIKIGSHFRLFKRTAA